MGLTVLVLISYCKYNACSIKNVSLSQKSMSQVVPIILNDLIIDYD